MFTKILAATALAVTISSAAFAQQDAAPTHPPVPSIDGPAGKLFFSDKDGMMMRSDDDIKMEYGKMSADDQAKVKADCTALPGTNMGDAPETEPHDVGANLKKGCSMVDKM